MISAEVVLPWSDTDAKIVVWCNAYIGQAAHSRDSVTHYRPWYVSFRYPNNTWHFANTEDATLFKLKWKNYEQEN